MNTNYLNTDLADEYSEADDAPLDSTVLGADEWGGALIGLDIYDLAELEVDFPALPEALAGCPVTVEELSSYLDEEVWQDGPVTRLQFVRTALAFGARYWVWEGVEPASGCRGYATVAAGTSIEIGFDVNWEDLTPEQFIVGVHHQII